MTEPSIRYFLGANSPNGFYSLYDQLIDPATAEDIFILKGGPGCGKSSLMRKVGKALEDKGLGVEYIECSGDPDSLDAILVPALQTAIVDGTAPHVVEPKYPGAVERYVNLGDCYDKNALSAIKGELMACMVGYKGCYSRAYRCLTAVAQLGEDARATVSTPAVEAKVARRAKGILSREVKKTGREPGHAIQRFLGGITWQGSLCRYATVDAQCKKVYELCDTCGLGHVLLTHLAAGVIAAGYDVVLCPSPLFPERIEHLLVPELSLAFVTSNTAHAYEKPPYRRIRLDAMADPELLRRNRARLRFGRKVAAALMDETVDALKEAKLMHDELEKLYNPHVDFARVYATAESIVDELLAREVS